MEVPPETVEWVKALRTLMPPPWPSDYVVIDTETSGLDPHIDLPLQFGCVIVRRNVIVHWSRAYIDWVRSGFISEELLRNKMAGIAAKMAERGATYRLDCDTVLREGQDPRVFIPALAGTLKDAVANGLSLVGHNMTVFDLIMLSRMIKQITGEPWLIPAAAVWDTGMLEKARQMVNLPSPHENQVQWFQRVERSRRKIKWKLDGHCADVYNLWALSGLDPTLAHDALSDSILTHHLFQCIKFLVERL